MNDKDKEAFNSWLSPRDYHFDMDGDCWLNLEIVSIFSEMEEAWQAACEYKQKEIDDLKIKLNVCKNDYWFMINLIERYSTDKEQALNDCLERMKFRKGLFNILEEE